MALLLLQLILAGQYEFIRLATLHVHDRKRAHGLPSPFSIASAEKDGDHQRNGVYSYPRLKKMEINQRVCAAACHWTAPL